MKFTYKQKVPLWMMTISITLNWVIKLIIGGLFYWVTTSLGAPLWVVIIFTSVSAAHTNIKFDWEVEE